MRVILRENIENLGKKGDIVKVAPGYGRNYLIPKKIAIEVTSRNMKMIAIEQKALQKGFEKEMASYQEVIDRLNAVTLSFTRKTSEKDIIFGSVSSTDIRDELAAQGIEVEKRKILLDEPIKRLGNFTVPIKIFHEERAEIKLEVIKEGEPGVKEEKEPEAEGVEARPEEKKEASKEAEAIPVKREAILEETQETAEAIKEIMDEAEGTQEKEGVDSDEAKETPEAREAVSEEAGVPEALAETQARKDEKTPTEEPSLEETEEAPEVTQEEPQDSEKKKPGESPEESGMIPEKGREASDEMDKRSERDSDIPEETKDSPKSTSAVPEKPKEKAEDKDSREAASKDNK